MVGLLFLPLVWAQSLPTEFQPNTVAEMTTTITLGATIELAGEATANDWMEVEFLTFKEWENQAIESIREELRFGDQIFVPEYKTRGENKIAVFTIQNLGGFGVNPEFEVIVNATIKTQSQLGLNGDFDLSSTLREQLDYLEATQYIESNALELQSKANLEFQSDSELESIREISEWVHANIEYDFENYYNGIFSAQETYQNRAGVCDEFANLSASFLRIKGIPAKYVAGISFDGKRFGNHGWLEAFLPGTGWIGVDATYGEAGYLNAAHIIQGKGKDASEIKNIVVTTHTYEAEPGISSVLTEPIVEVISIQFWKNVLDATFETPERLELNESFEIHATLTNQKNTHLLVPISLNTNPDFSVEHPSRIVWLKPLEEKAILWNAVSPVSGQEGYYVSYDMVLRLLDQQKTNSVSVYPEESNNGIGKKIEILDISPFISENGLKIHLIIQNPFLESKTIQFVFVQNNQENLFEETLPPENQTQVELLISSIVPGEIILKISGALEQNYAIMVPEPQSNQEPVVTPQTGAFPSSIPSVEPLAQDASILGGILQFFGNLWQGFFNLLAG